MPNPNIGQIVADEWEMAMTLAAYSDGPGSIGWHRGKAYRYAWNWRTGKTEWTRLPHRDTRTPPKPKSTFSLRMSYGFKLLDDRPSRSAVITGIA
jgi:hypothetical protein